VANIKKHVILTSSKLEPAIWSHNTGQHIPCLGWYQLTITWMSNIKEVSKVKTSKKLNPHTCMAPGQNLVLSVLVAGKCSHHTYFYVQKDYMIGTLEIIGGKKEEKEEEFFIQMCPNWTRM